MRVDGSSHWIRIPDYSLSGFDVVADHDAIDTRDRLRPTAGCSGLFLYLVHPFTCCTGVTPTCAAIALRSNPWASNVSTACRCLSVSLGGIHEVLRLSELVQHLTEPRVNCYRAIIDEIFRFGSSELLPKRSINS